ncbi:20323_t:CDS:2 [Cetraspora pellucida]|uniref:NTF2-related export protein n=1 Tax=Cetraspora pellucida TaxID=1433469 RepID=A0A9N9GI50_9GLOM|nr:20323_t:CDS:2 [Cetraspora pellucida]
MDITQVSKVATDFTNFYYSTFSADRGQLLPLYSTLSNNKDILKCLMSNKAFHFFDNSIRFLRERRDQSMLTFEGQSFQGAKNIIEKLTRVQHHIATIDAQPNFQGIFVCVTGELRVDEDNPQRFAQAFQLIPEGTSYYVLNDIFRLNYG